MKFRKKPVVIEAVQWTGGNRSEIAEFAVVRFDRDDPLRLIVPTLEGDLTASPGDWIIKGVHGEVHPCKPDIFAATYEPADDRP